MNWLLATQCVVTSVFTRRLNSSPKLISLISRQMATHESMVQQHLFRRLALESCPHTAVSRDNTLNMFVLFIGMTSLGKQSC